MFAARCKSWTPHEIERLVYFREVEELDWDVIGQRLGGRTAAACNIKYTKHIEAKEGAKRGRGR